MRRSSCDFCAEIILSEPASSEPRQASPEGLALAELVEGDDLGRWPRRFCRLGWRELRGESSYLGRLRSRDLELEPEIDRGIGEGRHRGERDPQPFRPALKAEIDRKRIFADFERPELMLQHDRHLVRKLADQTLRYPHTTAMQPTPDIQVMPAP